MKLMEGQSTPKGKSSRVISPPWWKTPPVIAMAVLAAISWIPYFLVHQSEELRNDGMDHLAVTGWGGDRDLGPGYLYVMADGNHFLPYRSKYKLLSLCITWDGLSDIVDAAPLYKSYAFDIKPGPIKLGIKPLVDKIGPNYALLALPIGVEPSSFSTIRQAQAMGAKFVWGGASVPPQMPK